MSGHKHENVANHQGRTRTRQRRLRAAVAATAPRTKDECIMIAPSQREGARIRRPRLSEGCDGQRNGVTVAKTTHRGGSGKHHTPECRHPMKDKRGRISAAASDDPRSDNHPCATVFSAKGSAQHEHVPAHPLMQEAHQGACVHANRYAAVQRA